MVERLNEKSHEDLECLQDYVEAVLNDAPEEDWCQAARRRLQDSLESREKENWIMRMIKNKLQGKLRWAVAVPLAALLVIALILGIPEIGGNSSKAFARVVRQIRNARTLVYTAVTQVPGMPAWMPKMKMEIAYKEPGLTRMSMGPMGISIAASIMDVKQKKMVTINTITKDFIETDLKNVPRSASNKVADAIDRLRNLPEKASEVLGTKDMAGRLVQGYRVNMNGNNTTAWIDARSGDLVTIEMDLSKLMPGAQAILSDFKFNVPLDDSLFSMAMPPGFHRIRMDMDAFKPDEQSLIDFLRLWANEPGEGSFPPSLDMMGVGKVLKAADKSHPGKRLSRDEELKKVMKDSLVMTKGLMVPMQMKPENDWHYAGQGVKFGDASQPVCWWKPDGSKTYRVILGDLSVIDLDLANLSPEGKPIIPDRH